MIRVTFLLSLISVLVIFPQKKDTIIAKIGNIEISQQEFQKRYELTPVMGKEIRHDAPALKKEVLYSLIAEKLFSLKAQEMNIDTSEIVKHTLSGYKKMFVRDALYKKEIREKAAQSADSLLNLYVGKASEVWFVYISEPEEKKINSIYDLLKNGVPFDSVYSVFSSLKDTLKTRIGDHDAAIEDKIFNLPEQSYTTPLFMDGYWYILKIVKKINPVLTQIKGWEEDFKRLKQTAQERAEQVYYKNYMVNFFRDKKVKADGSLLKLFAQRAEEILELKTQSRKSDTDKVFLTNIDILKIQSELDNSILNSIYIQLDNQPVTLKDFISSLRFENVGTSKVGFKDILDVLNGRTRKFIEQELLAREGFKEGLDKLPSVQSEYRMWRDNYYFYLIQNMVNDSVEVSDKEVLDYYSSEGKKSDLGDEVKIAQISVDSLEVIESILGEIEKGTAFESIAGRYSPQNVNQEFAPSAKFGEIGRLSESMKPGEIYGPIKTGEKYTLFKLINRRRKSEQGTFESEKENIKKTLFQIKSRDKLVDFTASLAMKYNISINENALTQVPVTGINSMMYQMLGFGGKIPAVPLSLPAIQWYNDWKTKHDIIQ
jgi:hypothetical protein